MEWGWGSYAQGSFVATELSLNGEGPRRTGTRKEIEKIRRTEGLGRDGLEGYTMAESSYTVKRMDFCVFP